MHLLATEVTENTENIATKDTEITKALVIFVSSVAILGVRCGCVRPDLTSPPHVSCSRHQHRPIRDQRRPRRRRNGRGVSRPRLTAETRRRDQSTASVVR